MFLGLRTVIYPAPDLDASKAWFSRVLGMPPYFDQPFYVGFQVGGYELGLLPDGQRTTTYWGVTDIDAAVSELTAAGATIGDAVSDVGDGIRVASVLTPAGVVVGVIENPHFQLSDPPRGSDGPGR